jgi:hypothetical protein
MKTLRLIIDRPETLAMPLVRWMEGHPIETAEILSVLITIGIFTEMTGA